MPKSKGVLTAPGLTVLVPHYGESIISNLDELLGSDAAEESKESKEGVRRDKEGGPGARRLSKKAAKVLTESKVMGFIVACVLPSPYHEL
jgi:hypothetical protein